MLILLQLILKKLFTLILCSTFKNFAFKFLFKPVNYKINFKVGDRICRPTDGGNRIGFYVACSKDAETLDKLMKEVDENVKIKYESSRI